MNLREIGPSLPRVAKCNRFIADFLIDQIDSAIKSVCYMFEPAGMKID
jgi:hypothetical protein